MYIERAYMYYIVCLQGVDPPLRNDVWKFLLNVYEWESTYASRTTTRKRKL